MRVLKLFVIFLDFCSLDIYILDLSSQHNLKVVKSRHRMANSLPKLFNIYYIGQYLWVHMVCILYIYHCHYYYYLLFVCLMLRYLQTIGPTVYCLEQVYFVFNIAVTVAFS